MMRVLQELSPRIETCMLAERQTLRRRMRAIERRHDQGKPCDRLLAGLQRDIQASEQRVQQRRACLPKPSYPAELPVAEKHALIAEAIARHQVVIVCGETGSGKTTQLPKICLELGRGVTGLIGHTQPRRIAARSVAARIASELDSEPGRIVGYKVRFRDHVGPETCIKLMTDGILLAEVQHDRFLNQYDTLIIDEAHERSLNIDFLLGYLQRLLPRRPDLKLVITSATIDPERFSRHFDDAPVIEVSGRTYPVEVRYRPLGGEEEEGDRDMQQGILDAVDELGREGPGDVLVFLSGEREIRETAEALRKHHPPHTEVLPLYARLGAAEQNRVFQPHKGRRIVLATNVAETSLTVPGIRYVVDPGYARMSRYSFRTKVQRLPIEKISQASANQRKGRCGRVAAGICIRLYSEQDFEARPMFTDPEIMRTNLASVILQMFSARLGEIEDFPFVEAPDPRMVKDGFRLLEELQALEHGRISGLGRQLARLPVDPRIGRMVIEAGERNCLDEVLVIASALSIQDPRERPMDKRQQADEVHTKFDDERSDFLALVNLWNFYVEQRRHLSKNKLRKLCRQNFLSHVRMEEWRDIHSQLYTQARDMDMKINTEPAEYAQIHQAVLSGLLANVGFRSEDSGYTGARNTRFSIFPASGLAKKRPKWIMAAGLMETTRLYGHMVAAIEPAWVERLGAHLIRRSYSEPHWEKRPSQVAAFERTTLYGLTINPRRRINFGPVDPATSREIFIRSALVGGDYESRAPFFRHNRELIEDVEALEHRSRRRDILVDAETLYRFYDERVPEGVYSGKHFEKWRRQVEQDNPQALFLTREYLMQHGAEAVTEARFPKAIEVEGVPLVLEYRFEPGQRDDGVTVVVPLPLLGNLRAERFQYLVPGMLREKVIQLIKTLPKALRRNFVPAPDFADGCMAALMPGDTPLVGALARKLQRMTGIEVPPDAWRDEMLPEHFLMRFRVVDGEGKTLGAGRDLARLKAEWQEEARASFAEAPGWGIERKGLTEWDFDTLPDVVETELTGVTVKGYPALIDRQDSVDLAVLDTHERALEETRKGLRRLFMLGARQQVKYLQKNLPGMQKMCLGYASIGTCDTLKQDLLTAIVDRAFLDGSAEIRNREVFESRLESGAGQLVSVANEVCALVASILEEFGAVRKQLKGSIPPAWLVAAGDVQEQLQHLIHDGFVSDTPGEWLAQFPRYLKGVRMRLEKLGYAPDRDRTHAAQLAPLWRNYLDTAEDPGAKALQMPELQAYRWMLEELRVSLFAQELKTRVPVSVSRLEKQWQAVQRALR